MAQASSSKWVWDPLTRRYRDSVSGVFAVPGADGQWTYEAQEEGEVDAEEQRAEDQEEVDTLGDVPGLRLVVLKSDCIKPPLRVAILDPSTAVTIGRDRTYAESIRIPSLSCSKVHANVFYLPGEKAGEGQWAISDLGSTTGTSVTRAAKDSEQQGQGHRLSAAKKASMPYQLYHLDQIRIGDTVLQVHLHPGSYPCDDCASASDSSNLISLRNEPVKAGTAAGGGGVQQTLSKEEREVDRRKKMKELKTQYLAPVAQVQVRASPVVAATEAPTQASAPAYVDRAKMRRERGDVETVHHRPSSLALSAAVSPAISAPSSRDSSPFSSTSRGAQLLSKLSAPKAGSDGLSEHGGKGLGQLIDPKTFDRTLVGARDARPGLGASKLVSVMVDRPAPASVDAGGNERKRNWQEKGSEATRKRWKDVQ